MMETPAFDRAIVKVVPVGGFNDALVMYDNPLIAAHPPSSPV
jgi:hypothetical protein